MSPWNWTWEERAPAAPRAGGDAADAPGAAGETPSALAEPSPGPPTRKRPPGAGGPGRASDVRLVRKRRLGAAAALAAIALLALAALLAASGSSHGRRAVAHARARAGSGAGALLAASPGVASAAAAAAALTPREAEAAVDHVLAYTPAVVEGGHRGDEVALTFDDGPGPYTVRLVRQLDQLHVQATFFAIGEMERYFSAGTIAEVRSGDVVGDHTETHPFLATMPAHEVHEELAEQMARVEVAGAPRPRLFRPPYGSFNATTFRELRALRLLMVLWSTDTEDYRRPGVDAIVQSALAGARPGAIILMHDGGGDRSQTIAALPAIVAGLRRRGLRPVTVPQLLRDDPPPPGQLVPHSLAGD